ncbi:1866_t:CDS:2 [Funneliformis caledonium]|uniref:1866_t:CDS:1 n=1 Tax=Funneliformis caledonium TaxID=1117310 RepID=A0A9N9D7A0_9GLOM|nr:1866_t:CDS:2 [Funneliformis caledonium]
MEVLPIPRPKSIKIPTLHEEDCIIHSQLIFSSFDVYYSELENVIIFFARGVNFADEVTSKNLKTEHLQFHSRIYDDYKINDTFQQTCTNDGIVINPSCQIEDVPIVTIRTTILEVRNLVVKSKNVHVELSVTKLDENERIGCVTASLGRFDNGKPPNSDIDVDVPEPDKKQKSKPPNESTPSHSKSYKLTWGLSIFGGISASAFLIMVAITFRKKIKAWMGCNNELKQ